MYKEDLIRFDKKVLSENSLLYGQYRWSWWLALAIPFVGVGLCYFIALYSEIYYLQGSGFLLMLLWFGLALGYGKSKTSIILRRHVKECKLNLNDIWNQRNDIIRQIQLHKLSAYLSGQKATIKQVLEVTQMLKTERQYPKYKYRFGGIFSIFLTVIISAFLGAVNAVSDMFLSWQSVVIFYKPLMGFSLQIVLFCWFAEVMVVRWYNDISNRKRERLIGLLENYRLNNMESTDRLLHSQE